MAAQWGEQADLEYLVAQQTEQCLAAYRAKPNLVEQDAGIEMSSVEGGYGRKQLHELVQNGADALSASSGRIALVLSDQYLYCANEGEPLNERGVEAIMASHLSIKRDDQIGRFGLGFKSVLGISDAPEIISRSVSIRFDRADAARRVREIKPGAERTAVLRVASTFDACHDAETDGTLRELMAWATTIVRLPLKPGTAWLDVELERFPPEFLLFAPHVASLELRQAGGRSATWTAQRSGNRVTLSTGDSKVDEWRIFTSTYHPSQRARRDAGEITGRDQVTMSWAVPLRGRHRSGQFWSYFPTNSQTTLSGIINAPFKTNEDRHDILDGLYNREILTTLLPGLISQNLEQLLDLEDPCSLLEILPARGREARSWADEVLNDPVMKAVADKPCLPDLDGSLRKIEDVKLTPEFLADRASWVERWVATPGRPAGWVHPSINKDKERRAKAIRLLTLKERMPSGVGEWLKDLATDAGVPGSSTAIVLASLINDREPDHMKEMRATAFIQTATDDLVEPIVGRIFLPDLPSDVGGTFVHPEIVGNSEALQSLQMLGVGKLNQLGKLTSHIQDIRHKDNLTGTEVERLWHLARNVEAQDAVGALIAGFGAGRTPVRTRAGRTQLVWDALLPGTIVPCEGSQDSELAIDTAFHSDDHSLLGLLGALAEPRVATPTEGDAWYQEWIAAAREAFMTKASAAGRRVTADQIQIIRGRTFSRLDVLPHLSDRAKAAFTRVVLATATEPWRIDSTRHVLGESLEFMNPGVWWVRKHGAVTTALGTIELKDAVVPGPDLPRKLLPIPNLSPEQVRLLELRSTPDLSDWVNWLRLGESSLDLPDLHRLYGLAAVHGTHAPTAIKAASSAGPTLESPEICVVSTSSADLDALLGAGHLVVICENPDESAALRINWGLADATGLVSRELLTAPSGESLPLVDRFPGLRAVTDSVSDDIELVPCSELAVEISAGDGDGRTITPKLTLRDGNRVYYKDDLTTDQLLLLVDSELRLGLTNDQITSVHRISQRRSTNDLIVEIKNAATLEEKLLLLAGEEAIKQSIPDNAISIAERRQGRSLNGRALARMAVGAHGTQILKKLLPAIVANGLVPPTRMSGATTAVSWVRDLGLPEELGGEQEMRKPAREEINGPVSLPSLHDYQELAVARVGELLIPGGVNRGLLALPTGSGKTRVAVEAVVSHIRESKTAPLVIWIAQTEELCEQAAETWAYVWRAIGSQSRLTLSRLWGSNDANPVDDGVVHLVIATDDKLESLRRRESHEWLTEADIVIVDEAHTSISKTYTALFSWLRRSVRESGGTLIGLSATPYRGTDEDQTRQLVNRYGGNLLTDRAFGDMDPHAYLQQRRILAKVNHQELEGMRLELGNAPVSLTATSTDRLHDYRIDYQKVASDEARNTRILDSLHALPTDMTALVFAASVQHAEVLAAVLNVEGISAASVSAYSPPAERRRIVEQFKNGDIRVLTNYNVLSQGFDAPKVGAVYVTRPTFSLNRYQQMIGRGLRGPLNGGSEEVLIVNIRDNIDAFGDQLAFHHFDRLWSRGKAA